MKTDKVWYIIYAGNESLIKKTDGCENYPKKSSTTKLGEHIPCGYSKSTILNFDSVECKHDLYRVEDCMKNFYSSLKENAINIIDFEKKKMLPLKKEKLKSHQDATVCYVSGKRFSKQFAKDKNYRKVRDHCHFTGKYRGEAHFM